MTITKDMNMADTFTHLLYSFMQRRTLTKKEEEIADKLSEEVPKVTHRMEKGVMHLILEFKDGSRTIIKSG